MKIPGHIGLANLPTNIERLKLSDDFKPLNIYIKRDDQTGTEVSGNKVRKLEFAVREALDQGATHLITCGGIQSNHARATAAVATKLGLNSILLLRGKENSKVEGNYFLDKMLGAKVHFVSEEDYREKRMDIMETIKQDLEKEGNKGYILPEGASNAIGAFGYYRAIEEISKQEEEMGIKFDAIVSTVGSGGTYAGQYYGNKVLERDCDIIGINICDSADFFKEKAEDIIAKMADYTDKDLEVRKEDMIIIDGYTGRGYAKSTEEELNFIHNFAKREGIILDPVYTGKAMYGFVEELKKGSFDKYENILFIHTGGIFGWTEEGIDLLLK